MLIVAAWTVTLLFLSYHGIDWRAQVSRLSEALSGWLVGDDWRSGRTAGRERELLTNLTFAVGSQQLVSRKKISSPHLLQKYQETKCIVVLLLWGTGVVCRLNVKLGHLLLLPNQYKNSACVLSVWTVHNVSGWISVQSVFCCFFCHILSSQLCSHVSLFASLPGSRECREKWQGRSNFKEKNKLNRSMGCSACLNSRRQKSSSVLFSHLINRGEARVRQEALVKKKKNPDKVTDVPSAH